MKKILVMGGNQFIGKEIVKKFLEKDNFDLKELCNK